jgi:hypothetical protein
MQQYLKRPVRFSIAAILLYFLGFLLLWLGGGYTASRSGMIRDQILPTGYPLVDTAEWQPLIGNCQPKYQWPGPNPDWSGGTQSPRCDAIGWAYYPFWLLVKSRNPTYALLDKDTLPFDTINPRELPNEFKFHPLKGKDLKDAFALIITDKPNNSEMQLPTKSTD